MPDLFPATLADVPLARQIQCVQREIATRQRCYPRWVRGGTLRQATAEDEILAMRAVLETLLRLEREGRA